MTVVITNPHLDEDGEYHGDRLTFEDPCKRCKSRNTWEQYNTTIGEVVYGCDDCGYDSF
jgi:epoxyqueuosine reductase QueG